MTHDVRTVYTVTSGSEFGAVSSGGFVTPLNEGSFVVSVDFPTYSLASGIQGAIAFEVASFSYLEIAILPYPSNTGSYADASKLQRIHCTDDYQRGMCYKQTKCLPST